MSGKYKVRNNDAPYFVTLTLIDWVDLFTRPVYKYALLDSLTYCIQNKGLRVHAFVIMTNHIHLIISSSNSHQITDTIRDFKKYTSRELIKCIKVSPESRKVWLLKKFAFAANRIKNGVNYKVWKDGFHPIELFNDKMIDQKLEYIHNNPVKEEIVIDAEDYKFSSAGYYAGGEGLIRIERLV